MHIKQITISNFRSFKQQPEIQPFSAGTNSVVGRNGSGKSNLFDAVQFVLLSPRFYTLRQEERQALLHEGSGNAAMNAFVEIVFDNSDQRFSLENSDEVVLRRTVGNKKDEFFLQRKRTTKQEITSLLEGAGFSKSNPYYMVQQGKIQDLCMMRDHERLNLLKQVAGTTVYDEKKQESLAKMEENNASIDKISQILKDIDERLFELQDEKDELTKYTRFDRERRCIEYTLYEKELSRARHFLDTIQHQRSEFVIKIANLHEQAKELHYGIRNTEAVLKTKTSSIRRNKVTLKSYKQDNDEVLKNITQMEFSIEEVRDNLQSQLNRKRQNEEELVLIEEKITIANQQLNEQIHPKYNEQKTVLDNMSNEMNSAKRKLDGLYAKQGRSELQFTTKEERDQHIQANVNELLSQKNDKENLLQEQQNALSNIRRTMTLNTNQIQLLKHTISEKTKTQNQMKQTIDEKKRSRVELLDERKQHWRKHDGLSETVREARENLRVSITESRKMTPKATSFGLEALSKIVQEERITMGEQFFGTVMDNFSLRDQKYRTAVEVAAQNSLYHVIVDTDATAARLMKRLEDGRLGRVTFLPLNRLNVNHNTKYPDQSTTDVKPLLEFCIEYDSKVERAMKHVFDKKLIARTPEIAAEYSAKYHMDAITLDGDLCSRKGALSGGYIDASKSRMKSYYEKQEATGKLHQAEKEQYELKMNTITPLDQQLAAMLHDTGRLELKYKDLGRVVKDHNNDYKKMVKTNEGNKKRCGTIEGTTTTSLQKDIALLDADMTKLQEELGTKLISTLSNDDKQSMLKLKRVVAELTIETESQSEQVNEIGFQKQKLESLLNDNLLKRQKELADSNFINDDADDENEASGIVDGIQQKKDNIDYKQRELESAVRLKEDIEKKLKDTIKMDLDLKADLTLSKNELEQFKNDDMENMKELEDAKDKSDRLLNKRTISVTKRETYTRKIQQLGSLPPTAELEEFTTFGISALMKKLETANKKLKKYSHVNKKAFDQYVNFSEQRESLLKRKDELDTGAEKVQELINNLDRQKDEAINRTFRGVSSHFKDVFKELVPNGGGELTMKTALDEIETDDNEETKKGGKKSNFDPNNPDVSLYRGIGIQVRFSKVGENFLMSQLSGGQKALVALALIFSIQRCDPAPFYLFDELDQALDSSYRSAVASLLQRQANCTENPTQFIVSTFRPELVSVADHCFGIGHQNKVSSLHSLTKKDALRFIASLMSEEEQLGETATIRGSKNKSSKSSSSRKRRFTATSDDDESDNNSDIQDDEESDNDEEETNDEDSQ